ncbi:DNA-directed RNA polymerase IV subunit 1 isoform X2 [Punica granatum]|uniref:DNA-directed RNA polymerase IV subunit 1 isoform X2 n=2 Tax=Punica granatum TaxID=22663 RepID=A0A6P8EE61_PUNGR|nr:DNA-directed RNA polymerase IV subunit 1 isoform X2 [Punica granatum]PKI53122.1 hypothetical protein CRG98_026484 [Punica granatum]
MENDYYEEQQVPSGILTGIVFKVNPGSDTEKLAALTINAVNEVYDPRLGLPNPTYQCSTCGAKNLKGCEGHYGCIKFPCGILHPYFLAEVAKILNKICPGCKSIRQKRVKATATSENGAPVGCKYCLGSSVFWYPPMKFRVPSSKDIFRKTSIIVEVRDKLPNNTRRKPYKADLAPDYWDILPKDGAPEDSSAKPYRRVLSPAQVHNLLTGVDLKFIQKLIPDIESLFLNCFPITPNCHRVTEVCHAFTYRHKVAFDNRTRAYRKLVDFRGSPNELGSRVLECLKTSKLNPDKLSSTESAFAQKKKNDSDFISSGLRWMKDVILGKRSNHCFRMVVVGNPNLKLSELGVPCYIAEKMQVAEILNRWNSETLKTSVDLSLLEKGKVFVRRRGDLVEIRRMTELEVGDMIYRPLSDGDTILINRPPSIHQHSLIALSVKVLPVHSCLSINPLCCSPLRGDFDGDCLHGYIPQSVEARVELKELAGLDKQLFNEQSGRNLLSFGQDSLLAAHLLLDSEVYLDQFQLQQLSMWASREPLPPAITIAPPLADKDGTRTWTGKQLFSMLLPRGFNWDHPSTNVHIMDGEILSSEGSTWLRDSDERNLIQKLVEHCQGRTLDFLHDAQEMLCEWLSMRGFSVALSDLYLSSDPHSRENMMEEVSFGLQEADETCNYRQLMVDTSRDFLAAIDDEENGQSIDIEPVRFCYEKQKSAILTQGSVESFRRVFRDIQNLAYKYASRDNSMLAMFKAGSKGNLLKVVQHSMCIGMQHSLVPLPFNFPHQLSCSSWNALEKFNMVQMLRDSQFPASFIPCAIVKNSFLSGLNPAECFVHSVTNRASSFSENAEVPGTLHRKLMFFLRDVYVSYDGTVRNSYGNQIVEFKYHVDKGSTKGEDKDHVVGIGGSPVGSASACAFSEAAYSALDQPISVLETSPLLNLKNVLECGSKKSKPNQTMSLFLSKKLGKRRHGFEYGALEVQDYLERRFFSDIVSTVMIIFTPANYKQKGLSPWVCHFHMSKDFLKKRGVTVNSIITSLRRRCNPTRPGSKANIPVLEITSDYCPEADKQTETHCITVSIVASTPLKVVEDMVIPFLLGTVVKGFLEIKKVDILWSERNTTPRFGPKSSGELYLRVSMFSRSDRMNLWNLLMDDCVDIMDAIDRTRSHPDNIADFSCIYGIDAGLKHFLNNLESAVSDTGKTVLPEHLLLVGNSLSTSGEFVSLNARGLARQREIASVSSPFSQACFSSPGTCFIKAAKAGAVDNLQGSLDALAWGKLPTLGTGELFDVVYSGKEHEITKPEDVYSLLKNTVSVKQSVKIDPPSNHYQLSEKFGVKFTPINENGAFKGLKKLEHISKSLRKFLSVNDVIKLSQTLRNILYKYPINHRVGDRDSSLLMMALYFHPNRDQKIGSGAKEIKVGHHSKHKDSRCFILVRNDGTIEDFSYHKCVHEALKIIAPLKAQNYQSKWLKHGDRGES